MTVPVPYSYRQYAGNESNRDFAVPFPYLEKAHVHVYLGFNLLDGTFTSELAETTGFTWTSGTVVRTVTAPATGTTLTVIRQTPNGQQLVEWQDGSNLISADLNTSDLQNLYVVQEQQDRNDAGIVQSTAAKTAATAATTAANTATSTANTATSTANTALSTANTALSTANTASTNASAAVTTANTASTNASAAVSTANSANTTAGRANTNAAAAVTTANSAAASASTAVTTANTASTNASAAVSTANTASSNASTAVSTANTASTNASAAVTTANSAATNASTALSTANTASTNASAAVATANAADTKADSAIAAVASSVNYTPILNVAGIPSTPANNTYIEIADSTGLQSFTPLAGMPAGFIGDAGLSVRLRYTTSPATWNWLNYYANNADSRYLKLAGGTLTGALAYPLGAAATPSITFTGDTNTGIYSPGADQVAISTAGSGRLFVDASGRVLTGVTSTSANVRAIVQATSANTSGSGNLFLARGESSPANGSDLGVLGFTDSNHALAAYIAATRDGGTWTSGSSQPSRLAIFTTPDGSASPTERLRITSAGLVGVGTSSPSSALDVSGAISFGAVAIPSAGTARIFSRNTDSNLYIQTGSGNTLNLLDASQNTMASFGSSTVTLQTANSPRLSIDSTGRVGIGVSSPSGLLHLKGGNPQLIVDTPDASTEPRIRLFKNNGTAVGQLEGISGNTRLLAEGAFQIMTNGGGGAGATAAYFDTSGRLGIGTTSPSQLLHLSVSSGINYIRTSNGTVDYYNGINSSNEIYIGSTTTHPITFRIGDSEKVRVDSSGRVGIGTSTPGYPLTIQSTSRPQVHVSYNGNGGLFVRDATDTARINWQVSTSEYTGGAFQITPSTTAGGTTFTTPAITVDSLSRVGIGTTTVTSLLHLYQSGSDTFEIIESANIGNNAGLVVKTGGNNLGYFAGDGSFSGGTTNLGISAPSGSMVFRNGASHTERARIDSSGRLGIGTSTVDQLLHLKAANPVLEVEGTAASSGDTGIHFKANANEWFVRADNGTGTNTFSIKSGSPASSTHRFLIDSSGRCGIGTASPSAPLHINGTANNTAITLSVAGTVTGYIGPAGFLGGSDSSLGYRAETGNNHAFFIGASEAARIDSSRRLLVGTSTSIDAMPLQVVGATAGQILLRHSGTAQWRIGPDSVGNDFVVYSSGTGGAYISNNGTSWVARSDERCKTNLVPIENGLNKISKLRAVTGRYIEDDSSVSRSFLIAQDVQSVLPEAVDTGREYLGLSYAEVIPLLVAALKESKERIETLEAKVAALESV